MKTANEQPIRFSAIHGMRGVAAMGVVLFHLSANLQSELELLLPDVINLIFSYGYLGVPIFFVISGFVISYSASHAEVTGRYVSNFILRRSIRLDLVYWASILLSLVLLWLKGNTLGQEEGMPSFTDVILHMLYLQDLLQVEPLISVVYWTLCLELQFYLFYIFSLWFSSKVAGNKASLINLLIVLCMGGYSILLDIGLLESYVPGLFVSNWHYFLMGVLVCHVIRRTPYSHDVFMCWLLIEVFSQLITEVKPYIVAGIVCSTGIYLMWRFELLDKLFSGKLLAYLGTISYTLYLVHPDIGWKTIAFGKLLIGNDISPVQSGVLLIAGVSASIIVAHIFYLIFERPTLAIAAKVKSEPLGAVLKSYFINKFKKECI